jgi:hypothetical protein
MSGFPLRAIKRPNGIGNNRKAKARPYREVIITKRHLRSVVDHS